MTDHERVWLECAAAAEKEARLVICEIGEARGQVELAYEMEDKVHAAIRNLKHGGKSLAELIEESTSCIKIARDGALDEVDRLERQSKEMRELGPCGKHPKACWIEYVDNETPDNRMVKACSSCQREKELVEECVMDYEAHYHRASGSGDSCEWCGKDLRDLVHLRSGETKEMRVSAIRAKLGVK